MREYRGLRKDSVWVYGCYCRWENRHYITSEPHETGFSGGKILTHSLGGFMEVIPESVGESTGLHDKTEWEDATEEQREGYTKETWYGVEIYGEGDIYKDAKGVISVVKMAVDGWALFPIEKGTPVWNLYWHNVCIKTQGEVIGNVHQHKHLLEAGQ